MENRILEPREPLLYWYAAPANEKRCYKQMNVNSIAKNLDKTSVINKLAVGLSNKRRQEVETRKAMS